jgi:hydrogenase expression/formation protein HypD
MLRVPGSHGDLLTARADGADVRVVYSPMDALQMARDNPRRPVVFFAVGFETTAPANAMAVMQAHRLGVHNFLALISHVLVPPAIQVVLDDPGNRVQGFLAPGHVCAVMGVEAYAGLSTRYRVPFVVAGFEPLDLLQGLGMLVDLLEEGRAEVANQYTRSVRSRGNQVAQQAMREAFEVTDTAWRGIGVIRHSGLRLREPYAAHDAERRFALDTLQVQEAAVCIAGQVLQGKRKPHECPAFGTSCTPESPLGAPMVSAEGACSAYYAFRRHDRPQEAHGAV